MSPDSITEREFTRSIHVDADSKDTALKHTAFHQDQLAFYLTGMFADRADFTFECSQQLDSDRVYTIRKGSAILTVKTVFGIDTSYKDYPPRKFFTFTATASHRNEVLDDTEKTNDFIEWVFRTIGGISLGAISVVILLLFGGHAGIYLITLAFAFGAALGSFIGQHLARKIYTTVETRLEARGEITAIDQEWAQLIETMKIVFDDSPAGSSG